MSIRRRRRGPRLHLEPAGLEFLERRHGRAPADPEMKTRSASTWAARAGRSRSCSASRDRPLRREPAGLLPRHERRGPRHDLSGRALRPAAWARAVRGGLRQRRPARDPGRPPPAGARPRVAQPGRRGRSRRRSSAVASRVADRRLMSARTRELFGLLPVSLLVAAGFAAVLATARRTSATPRSPTGRCSSACAWSPTCSSAPGSRTPIRTCSRWWRCSRRSAWW